MAKISYENVASSLDTYNKCNSNPKSLEEILKRLRDGVRATNNGKELKELEP